MFDPAATNPAPVDVAAATVDLERRPYEQPNRMEMVADLTQSPST